jgi:hypothetical protein
MECFLAYSFVTLCACEAIFMPLAAIPAKFHGSGFEWTATLGALGSEVLIPTVTAIKFVVLGAKCFLDKRFFAF